MFRFASAYFLLFLAAVPAAIYFRRKKRINPRVLIPETGSLKGIHSSFFLKARWIIPALKYSALVLMIIALARPQWGTRHISIITEGINIIMAVDISESMAALDFKQKGKIINRLQAVKGVVEKFISKRNGDRIGMVVFGSEAYTQVPLTRDYNTMVSVLDRIKIGAAGKSTAIGDAIGISLKRLEDIKSKSNIIILLTDGQSNAGELSPESAVEIAKQKNVKIYTIGVGSKGKAPYLVNHPVYGEKYVYRRVNIDEKTLKDIAKRTGGQYFRAKGTAELLEIYNTIDALEKTEVKTKSYAQYQEFYIWLLLGAFLMTLLQVILSNTRFLRVP